MQRIIEGQNLDIKITLYKYSSFLEKQRKIIHKKRQEVLLKDYAAKFIQRKSPRKFKKLQYLVGKLKLNDICRQIYLFYIDKYWEIYLAMIADFREIIHLRRISGEDPFFEFQKIAIESFENISKKERI